MHVGHYVKWLVNPAQHEISSPTYLRWLLLLHAHRRTDGQERQNRKFIFLIFIVNPPNMFNTFSVEE
jgi:hypothetical protein